MAHVVSLRQVRSSDSVVTTPRVYPCAGKLCLDGWHGRSYEAVVVTGETPERYRITAPPNTVVRLAGRSRTLAPGQVALVPKHAITFEP